MRIFGIVLGSLGGTCFAQADLTRSNFSQASLKSTNFRAANITHIYWKDALFLDRARVGESILANLNIITLLTSLYGYSKNYENIDLRGANLTGANLEKAILKHANLSQAILRGANLKEANLTESLCVSADFTHAYLTGACLQGWNIDHQTQLADVDCQHVFFLEHPNPNGHRERRPHDHEKSFQPGDFAKLYTKIMNTVELLLRHGANGDAFRAAFQKIMEDYPDITTDSIQEVKKVGEDVKVIIQVPEDADKGIIEHNFDQFYNLKLAAARTQARLEAKEETINDLKEIIAAITPHSVARCRQTC